MSSDSLRLQSDSPSSLEAPISYLIFYPPRLGSSVPNLPFPSRKDVDCSNDQLQLLECDLRAAMDENPPTADEHFISRPRNQDTDGVERLDSRHLAALQFSVPLSRDFVIEAEAAKSVVLWTTIDSPYESLIYDAFCNQGKTSPAETLNRLEALRLRSSIVAAQFQTV